MSVVILIEETSLYFSSKFYKICITRLKLAGRKDSYEIKANFSSKSFHKSEEESLQNFTLGEIKWNKKDQGKLFEPS